MASSPSSIEPTASTIVFSLAHLRDSIFASHALYIKQRRDQVLASVSREMSTPIWGPVDHFCFNHHVRNFFEMDLRRIRASSNIFELAEKLGLTPATWLDFCVDRPRDLNAWLTLYSNIPATEGASKFQPHPRAAFRSGGRHDEPQAVPMEMLFYLVEGEHYAAESFIPRHAQFSQQYLMRNDDGGTFLLRIVDTSESFVSQAIERCPDLLFSRESPFYPIHDYLPYSDKDTMGILVTSTPPAAFSQPLDILRIRAADELRRVVERARDIYWHLAVLEEHGISLDGDRPSDGFQLGLAYAHWGAWLLPSYVRPSPRRGKGNRFTRNGHVDEDLPDAPASPWPLPIYSVDGSVVEAIPWSQSAAFQDLRVPGPTTYLHGLEKVSWLDEGASERRQKNLEAEPKKEHDLDLKIEPNSRFHADLVMMTTAVLEDFTRGMLSDIEEIITLLDSSTPSDAYLATLSTPVEKLPRASNYPISALFTFCWVCHTWERQAHQAAHEDRSEPFDGNCPTCKEPFLLCAIPEPLRLLLLRIVDPDLDDDNQPIIVKAQEAFEVFDNFLQTDMARIEAKYKDWAAHQNKVVRPDRPKDLSLATIMEQEGYHRLLLFEHLRGRFLDDEPLLPETRLYTMKYFIRDQLTPTQKRKVEELRAICGSLESGPQASAASSSGKRAAESDVEKEAESEKKAKVASEQEGQVVEASEDMNVDHADE